MAGADHLADALDGRTPPEGATERAYVNLAERIGRLPLATAPANGWDALDARFATLVAGDGGLRWYEGWLGARPRPLVQRLAAGMVFAGFAGGAGGAAAGVTPLEAVTGIADATSGFVRYVTFQGASGGSDGGPAFEIPAASATPPESTTPDPAPGTVTPQLNQTVAPAVPPPGEGTPVVTATPELRTFAVGDAGTITLRVEGTTVTLVSTAPAAGWSASGDEADDLDEVDVTFTNGDLDAEFSAEFDDGQLVTEVNSESEDED